jgi:hypothetical protein
MALLNELKKAVSNLNPDQVRQSVDRPLKVGLVAPTSAGYEAMEDFLAPAEVSADKRGQISRMLHRAGELGIPDNFDLVLYEGPVEPADNAFTFYPQDPERTVREILEGREELGLPLARHFYPFRKPVVDRIIHTISRENALFALATALPNIVPSLIELPWAIGEFASDSVFLTMNQIRMALLIAAASDNEIGYGEQKGEIATIITSAFGWRALARELVGKIPVGGGLIPKGAIAFAGTYAVGKSLERFHRFGYGLTRNERREVYHSAFERGKGVAQLLLSGLRKINAV